MSVLRRLQKAFPFQVGGQVEVEVGSYRRFMRRDYYWQKPDDSLTLMPDVMAAIHECETDQPASQRTLHEMLDEAGVKDGDEFEILITRTDVRPHGDRRFIMDKWGNTRPETDEECLERIENQGDNQ